MGFRFSAVITLLITQKRHRQAVALNGEDCNVVSACLADVSPVLGLVTGVLA